MSDLAVHSTIATCALLLESYERALGSVGAHGERPLLPLDAFVLDHFIGTERSVDVVDLAADATGGRSTALFGWHRAVRRVSVCSSDGAAPGQWRDRFSEAAAGLDIDAAKIAFGGDVDEVEPTSGIEVVVVSLAGADPAAAEALVAGLIERRPAHAYVFVGIGGIGDGGPLEGLLAAVRRHGTLELRAVRELSPFLASSDVAVAWPAVLDGPAQSLARLAGLFTGNFAFLDQVRAIVERTGAGPSGEGAAAVDPKYQRLAFHLRQVADATLPAHATVAVVSRGDDALLDLGDRQGVHFPRDAQGQWSGHYPGSAHEVIGHLEDLRGEGVEYLLIPYTAFWWLGYYVEFTVHLDCEYRRVWNDDSAVIYDLARI